jgi:hypothetical protein
MPTQKEFTATATVRQQVPLLDGNKYTAAEVAVNITKTKSHSVIGIANPASRRLILILYAPLDFPGDSTVGQTPADKWLGLAENSAIGTSSAPITCALPTTVPASTWPSTMCCLVPSDKWRSAITVRPAALHHTGGVTRSQRMHPSLPNSIMVFSEINSTTV